MFKVTNFPATWKALNSMWLDQGEPKVFTLTNNTVVKVDFDEDDMPVFEVLLHGSKIVTLKYWSMTYTMAGWPTPTTKQRVNRFLADNRINTVHTHLGVSVGHHGEPIGDYEEVKVDVQP